MNVYDVWHVNGDVYEIVADFFERDGDDWAFYLYGVEAFRVAWADVVSVSKGSVRPAPVDREPENQAT
jgi:hypothetical protein